MDPIDRNDPYPPKTASRMDSISRNDPYADEDGTARRPTQDVFYYFRLFGSLLGVLIALTGLYFAILSFDIVRGILQSPQQLNAYLDEWYIPPKEAAAPPAPPETEKAVAPDAAQGADTESSPPPEQAESPAPEAPAQTEAKPDEAPKPPLVPATTKPVERQSRREVPGRTKDITTVSKGIELLTDALTRGGLPRLAGAIVLLLLVSMLIRIPFGLIKAGVEFVRAMIPD